MSAEPVVRRVTGALVEAAPMPGVALFELVHVGRRGLLGEVIRIEGDRATLQVFEDTEGVSLGEPVQPTGRPLCASLGPGLLGGLLDGIGRPLERLAADAGDFIRTGASASTLDASRRWHFEATRHAGDVVQPGDEIGLVHEAGGFVHHILAPPGVGGTIGHLTSGEHTVDDAVGILTDGTVLRLSQSWPIRVPRPIATRLPPDRPFITGQRVLDFFFPVAEGGSAALPGGFGTGKTVVEHSLAKFGSADVLVYVGCGERGNEMAEVVREFPTLVHPATGRPVMERAVLIANTSNMPVAAREASIYLGVTIAEYFRDMGYRVALMIDSISRWAEALREIASRLQEMPGEEGYPTSLSSRFGSFLERAGRVRPLGVAELTGAVTIVSAISPPGGDFSEPVTQAALRVAGALWALDADLAHQRHFPAVDWATSYSLYTRGIDRWFLGIGDGGWTRIRGELARLLQRERELREIAGLVGTSSLSDEDRLTMDVASLVRDVLLRQSAYAPNDASSPPEKTYAIAAGCAALQGAGMALLEHGTPYAALRLARARAALAALRDAAGTDVALRAQELATAIARIGPPGDQSKSEAA